MSKDHLRKPARTLYIHQHLTLEEISVILPVSTQTLCKWSNRYRWKEQRDKLEIDPATLSAELRQKLANNLRQLEIKDDGTYGVNWDDMSKAASAVEKLGGVEDEVSAAIKTMDKFTRYILALGWTKEKLAPILEAVPLFLDKLGQEAY